MSETAKQLETLAISADLGAQAEDLAAIKDQLDTLTKQANSFSIRSSKPS